MDKSFPFPLDQGKQLVTSKGGVTGKNERDISQISRQKTMYDSRDVLSQREISDVKNRALWNSSGGQNLSVLIW